MSSVTQQEILKQFDSKLQYLSYPIEFATVPKLIKLIDLDDYLEIFHLWGETYLLIILDMFERREEFDTCAEIMRQIKLHQPQLKTRLTDLKKIFD